MLACGIWALLVLYQKTRSFTRWFSDTLITRGKVQYARIFHELEAIYFYFLLTEKI